MPFGQIPTPIPSSLGEWVISLAMILIILDRGKALFWPNKPRTEQYVDQTQFSELKETLANYVTRIELKRLEDDIANLTAEHKELSKYTHDRVHELASSINQIHVRIEVLHRELHKDIENLSREVTALTVLVDHVKEIQSNLLTLREQVKGR